MHDLAFKHNDLIKTLERIDANKTREVENPVLYSMLLRSPRIRHEVNEYISQDDAVREVDTVHINNNDKSLIKIYRSLN